MKKEQMEKVIRKEVDGFKQKGYLRPSPVIKVALYMHLNEGVASPSIFDELLKVYGKLPEKAKGWFVRRLMEIGAEVFGEEMCQAVAGVYYTCRGQDRENKRWKVGVAMAEKYWFGKK